MSIARRQFVVAAASAMFLGSVGCTSVSKNKDSKPSLLDRMPWSSKQEPEPYPNPVKLAATWTPDTLVQSGRTPTRGFGGRLFFYDEKSRPVPVEGTLNVHGFNELTENPNDAVKKFEFTPEQFTTHFSQTDLGASYSVWIPWDAVGSNQKRITLVPSFKTREGKIVQGTPSTVVLPGPLDPATTKSPQYSTTFKDHTNAIDSDMPPTSGLTTTTIRRRYQGTGAIQTAPNHKKAAEQTMVAGKTPSIDMPTTRRRTHSGVLPASAQLPTSR